MRLGSTQLSNLIYTWSPSVLDSVTQHPSFCFNMCIISQSSLFKHALERTKAEGAYPQISAVTNVFSRNVTGATFAAENLK